MLDFRIVTFLTVCDTRNYTRAAEQLHITQPAVSQHIRYLEETYGTKLFCSEGRRLTLTPEGEVLRRTAAAMTLAIFPTPSSPHFFTVCATKAAPEVGDTSRPSRNAWI